MNQSRACLKLFRVHPPVRDLASHKRLPDLLISRRTVIVNFDPDNAFDTINWLSFFLFYRHNAEIPVNRNRIAGMDERCCIRYAGDTGQSVLPRDDCAVDEHPAPAFDNS